MPLDKPYIVWKANPVEWNTEEARGGDRDSPHGQLTFIDGTGHHNTDINVRSKDRVDHRLVFWTGDLTTSTAFGARIIADLESLNSLKPYKSPPPLDHLHDGFLDIRAGIIRDTNMPGPNNDITDDLDAFFNAESADFKRSTLYIWGEHYKNSGGGVHQVHMNQGNYKRNRNWFDENGRGQDGGIVMRSPDGRKWKYFFIAFAGQASDTDDKGRPKDGDATLMLRDVIHAPPPVVPTTPVVSGQLGDVQILSALINPRGPDDVPGNERVRLVNRTSDPISLYGWTIQNQDGMSKQLPDVLLLGNNAVRDFAVGPESYLPNNRDGEIVLKDAVGTEIDRVSYLTGAPSGQWISFHNEGNR
ncbi:uncharacterized protein DNG_02206 [Cephalotrichum gorgonifer]|uniref:LTD domain-containing protein n=1 Tax=Cephalotrichum gorgonifer TaxID=2041049 RepID=A0AAE8MT70_9PEZI|nr:uncharacterized protein DNG_02206 [Cephalotrichum gorgonifer]